MIKIKDAIYLGEMATVHKESKYNIMVSVNTDKNKNGEKYFNFYNSNSYTTADKVIRISFDEPKYIYHKNMDGKLDWILNSKEKKELVEILNKQSEKYSGYSVWETAKFDWNNERMDTMLNVEKYIKGEYDKLYSNNPNYVPLSLDMPDYTKLR